MSPTKRPSSVAGLRRAVGVPTAGTEVRTEQRAPAPTPAKPARVTLNMPPELYRELDRWTRDAADAIGLPRVSIQDALRAMVKAGIRDSTTEAAVLTQLRQQENEGSGPGK
jgi:hypothetical protein